MSCEDFNDHEWVEGYYGLDCVKCDAFIPYGLEPWLPVSDDYSDWEEDQLDGEDDYWIKEGYYGED